MLKIWCFFFATMQLQEVIKNDDVKMWSENVGSKRDMTKQYYHLKIVRVRCTDRQKERERESERAYTLGLATSKCWSWNENSELRCSSESVSQTEWKVVSCHLKKKSIRQTLHVTTNFYRWNNRMGRKENHLHYTLTGKAIGMKGELEARERMMKIAASEFYLNIRQ